MTPFALALVVALVAAAPAKAADEEGRFAIKGAGLQSCGAFVDAWDEGSADLGVYGGWIDGYVTGLNQHLSRTFDLAPWQTTTTLLGMMKSICDQTGRDVRFMDAFDRLARALLPLRLDAESEVEAVRRGPAGAVLYEAVVRAVQARLEAEGHPPARAPGEFDDATARALEAFQQQAGLPVTGLPDQRTLFALLFPAGAPASGPTNEGAPPVP